ncbi:MAG: sugar ABC transporter substrate-binding protein [Alicyclobacillus herbarius]|uniref:ABC transporter substrate-binding protein n=1 Tax=Alicyclobacillus herbarius TaxID=122960 RepID=UPI0023573E15|nr:sugar ABC transporter substrate-binding protein [Alicyclobacillus herbarius]MCL6632273.1 sugar ABC transporter substrate-binding protein [Alicyclobacillus herbarius]
MSKTSTKAKLCSAIAVVTLGVTVSACGSQSGTGNTQTKSSGNSDSITLTIFTSKYTANPQAQEQFLNKLASEFEQQNPGIKVEFTYYDSASQENTTLQTSLATKQGPDIFDIGTTFVPTAYAMNGFHVLSQKDWNKVGGMDKFFPAQLKMSGPSPDKYIAVPWEMVPFGLVYNKKLLKEAGIASAPKTWTEFVQDAQKLTNPAKNQWGTAIDPADSFDPWHVGWVLTKQLGGDFVSSDLKQATLGSAAVVKGLTFWFDWVQKYKIASPNDLTYKGTDQLREFENGHVAMLVMQGASLIPSLESSAVKNDYAFAPMPTIPYGMNAMPKGGVPVQTFVSGNDFAVPKYVTGKRYDAALKWIKFFTDVPQQREMFKVYGNMPINVNAFKNNPELNTPVIKAFVDAENHAYPIPFTPAWANIEVVYGGVANKIANEIATHSYHDGDIAAALKAANQQAQSSLQQ